jgi:hypothetical protein
MITVLYKTEKGTTCSNLDEARLTDAIEQCETYIEDWRVKTIVKQLLKCFSFQSIPYTTVNTNAETPETSDETI